MVQVLIWNGEDRPPIITVDGPFSNGNPTVGDTLVVRRAGTAVGTIELKRIQFAERRAFFEVLTGQMPEAGDVLRWNGNSDANVVGVSEKPMRRGDISSLTDDGAPISSITYSTKLERHLTPADRAAGEWSDFVLVDVPGPTAQQAKVTLANRLADLVGLPGTPRRLPELLSNRLRVAIEELPAAAIASMRDNSQVTATPAQLVPLLRLKRGTTLQEIRDAVTFNGREMAELTTYL